MIEHADLIAEYFISQFWGNGYAYEAASALRDWYWAETDRPHFIGLADVRNEASNEIRHQYLDASKARTMLGWAPAFTFEASLRATIDWYTRYFAATGSTPEPETSRG